MAHSAVLPLKYLRVPTKPDIVTGTTRSPVLVPWEGGWADVHYPWEAGAERQNAMEEDSSQFDVGCRIREEGGRGHDNCMVGGIC